MTDGGTEPKGGGRREGARLVVALVLVVLAIAFVVDNTRSVKVGFVFADHSTRLIYVLIATAALGAVLDRLWVRHRRH